MTESHEVQQLTKQSMGLDLAQYLIGELDWTFNSRTTLSTAGGSETPHQLDFPILQVPQRMRGPTRLQGSLGGRPHRQPWRGTLDAPRW